MSPERSLTLDLPLLLTGVPAAVQGWLRLAGVPFAPFRLASLAAGRIVLYDSRIVASRCDAEAARATGLKTIDILPFITDGTRFRLALPGFLRGRPSPESARARFFLQLKHAVERSGGVWARLADFPFPWQSAACSGEGRFLPEFATLSCLFAELPDVTDAAAATTWIRDRYARGLPFALPDRHDAPEVSPDLLAEINTPLLWRTSFAEFARWRRVRSRLALRLRLQDDAYDFACEGEFDGFRPMLELWQGGHVALLPLPNGPGRLHRSGLAFQYEPRRLPGGLASQFAEAGPEESSPAWCQSQSA